MKRAMLLLSILCSFAYTKAQQEPNVNIKKYLPTSPEAAILGRYGDIPVSLYTGTANISIPLYTIKEGDYELPIVLNYATSGVKVSDEATNVGLGWHLDPDYAIVQKVNGARDGSPLSGGDNLYYRDSIGWNYLMSRSVSDYGLIGIIGGVKNLNACCKYWALAGSLLMCTSIATPSDDSQATTTGLLWEEGQPDIYNYYFDKNYGKFYINPKNGRRIIMDKKDHINFSILGDLSGIHSWRATTLDGTQYNFTETEYIENINTLWFYTSVTQKISTIKLPNSQKIKFTYYKGWYRVTSGRHESLYSGYPTEFDPDLGSNIKIGSDITTNHILIPDSIISENVIVKFNLEDRNDLECDLDNDGNSSNGTKSAKRIKSIDIINRTSNLRLKSFNLYYSYFTSNTIGGSFRGDVQFVLSNSPSEALRLRLDSLVEIDYGPDGTTISRMPAYKFEYEPTVLPLKSSCAIDFWGYYNAQDNKKTFMPDLSYFYYNVNPSYSYLNPDMLTRINGVNRFPSKTAMTAASLTKITYPTGGYSQFVLAPNTFNNYYYPDAETAKSKYQDVIDAHMSAINRPDTYFQLPSSQIVHFDYTISRGANTSVSFEMLQQSQIFLLKYKSNGSIETLKSWQMPLDNTERTNFINNGYKKTGTEDVYIPYEPGARYRLWAVMGGSFTQQLSSSAFSYVSASVKYYSASSDSISYGPGIRLVERKNYLSNGVLAEDRTYRYVNENGSCSGKIMLPLKFDYDRTFQFAKYIPMFSRGITGDFTDCREVHINKMVKYINSNVLMPSNGYMIGYSRVEEQINDIYNAGRNTGKHIYLYNNYPDNRLPIFSCPNNPNHMNGLLNKETLVDEAGSTVKTIDYTYDNLSQNDVPCTGLQMICNYVGDDDLDASYPKYSVYTYPITNAWYVPKTVVTSTNSSNGTVNTTEDYKYNSIGQLVQKNTTSSGNKPVTDKNLYPVDYTDQTDDIVNALVSHNYLDYLLESVKYVDSKEVEKTTLRYLPPALYGVMGLSSIDKAYNGGTPFNKISIDKYDDYKHPLQVTQDGITHTMLWSYNRSYLVADITGTDYSTVMGKISQQNIDNATTSDENMRSLFNALRNALPNNLITTYTYRPLVGMTSATAPNGVTTYYEYDTFNRLKRTYIIENGQQKTVQSYDYHYKQ